jgi:hypothetical protein
VHLRFYFPHVGDLNEVRNSFIFRVFRFASFPFRLKVERRREGTNRIETLPPLVAIGAHSGKTLGSVTGARMLGRAFSPDD